MFQVNIIMKKAAQNKHFTIILIETDRQTDRQRNRIDRGELDKQERKEGK